MHRVFPHLWIVLLLPLVGVVVTWRDREAVPKGLVPLLLTAVPFTFAHREAGVIWMMFFAAWLGWLATRRAWIAVAVMIHAVLSPAMFAGAVLFVGLPETDFFTLSSLRTRHRMLDVLTEQLGMKADEFETLSLHHPRGEDHVANALEPGVPFLVDRVRAALPPGGDRCLSVSDPEHPPPEGVELLQEVHDGPLVYRAWRDPHGCPGEVRLPSEPVVVFDLNTGELREVRP